MLAIVICELPPGNAILCPLHPPAPPEAMHELAFSVVQLSVVLSPSAIVSGDATKLVISAGTGLAETAVLPNAWRPQL